MLIIKRIYMFIFIIDNKKKHVFLCECVFEIDIANHPHICSYTILESALAIFLVRRVNWLYIRVHLNKQIQCVASIRDITK